MSTRRNLLQEILRRATAELAESKRVPHPEFHLQVVCERLIEAMSLMLLSVDELKAKEEP